MHSNLMTSGRSTDRSRGNSRWLLPLLVMVGLLLWLPIVARRFRLPATSHVDRMQGRELRSDIDSALFESPAPVDLPLEPGLPATTPEPQSTSPTPVAIPGGA